MSQTIAICIYDPGETLPVVCLYLRQFAFPITPLLPLPCKCNSCSRPVGDVSDIQCLAQGEAQLTGRIQGSQTRLLPTRFVMRDPKKVLCRDHLQETVSHVASCRSHGLCPGLG